jgi:hypothetical protein
MTRDDARLAQPARARRGIFGSADLGPALQQRLHALHRRGDPFARHRSLVHVVGRYSGCRGGPSQAHGVDAAALADDRAAILDGRAGVPARARAARTPGQSVATSGQDVREAPRCNAGSPNPSQEDSS